MKKKLLIIPFLSIGLAASIANTDAEAYQLYTNTEAPKMSAPKDVRYWVDPDFAKFNVNTAELTESINKWDSTPEIEITKKVSLPGGADITMEYIDKYSGSTFANYTLKTRGKLTFFKKWRKELNASERRETVVHEAGHALGLKHTQKKNNSISVMREFDFNGKAYPLSDDKAGIAKRY